jgi:hypothetical protein
MDNKQNIGTLVVQLKENVKHIEQATQHSPPRVDVEAMLHDLIHTASEAVYVLSKTRK